MPGCAASRRYERSGRSVWSRWRRADPSGRRRREADLTLLRADEISLAFGSRTVFRDLTLVVEEGERVGLIGVNGSGKSSLMRILAGATPPDHGELQLQRGAKVTWLQQEPTFVPGATVASELTAGGAPA